ncbi:MarR family winged helix-turn-helix transcriptional regulator [Sphingobium aromaticiconvertens]|uniref:MarR family winged helix-turn-helix transcriptional regulator n=1 Tax=Sphingobium aromaticiconvertens TaxID=365341 RepID=UPI0030190F36
MTTSSSPTVHSHVTPASPLFLREDEVRRGIEMLYFGYSALMQSIEQLLEAQGLGRAHHRALYFISRKPDLTIGELLRLLSITKQSLGRVLNDLIEQGYIETQPGVRDRRQKMLRLSSTGKTLEAELFRALREKMATAYGQAGQGSVTGFWRVLEGLIANGDRQMVLGLQAR